MPFRQRSERRNSRYRAAHERRQRNPVGLSRLFQEERPRGRGLEPAGAAQRPDADVHQCRHGAVQERLHRPGAARPIRARPPSQKCVRAGGKHNDLDNVGYTARHHTFFEMLGNFSFGDYFKERAIELAWNLITKEFGLAEGPADSSPSITTTTRRSASGRRSPGLPESRIIRIADSATISGRWATPARAARARRSSTITATTFPAARPAAPDADGDRFIEIWNLVFMQFEQVTKDERVDLPRPSIDTGMGLERIAAVLQGVHDNYDIDLFRALIARVRRGDRRHGRGQEPRQPPRHRRPSARVELPDRRRRAAVERGPRLCAAPHHAPRHAPCAAARRARAADVAAGAGAGARDGRRPIRSWCAREPLITETLKLEETRFRKTLARGLACSTRRPTTLGDGRPSRRRDRVQALRHLRLPARPDAGRAAPARHRASTPTASTRRWSGRRPRRARAGPARARRRPRRSGSPSREQAGATEFLGYDTETAEGVDRGARQGRRESSTRAEGGRDGRASSSTRRRSTANRAARSATPARS